MSGTDSSTLQDVYINILIEPPLANISIYLPLVDHLFDYFLRSKKSLLWTSPLVSSIPIESNQKYCRQQCNLWPFS